ncbi:MAG: 50S ribosomal protein L23 [Candidatus Pacebacteria bacterium]|nr:50S ribosomal protein L23 [Candidatus Paceibacterota bacterium]
MTENKKNTKTSTTKTIIIRPRVTEKTATLSDKNVYTFEVSRDANKNEIKKEIERIYKVKPIKVNIAKISEKKVFVKGRFGKKSGGKKAYVFLKKGDKISFL